MNKETYEALKRLMYLTIWKDTGTSRKDIDAIMDWIDEVKKEYDV